MGLCPHIHFTPPWPFPPVQIIMSQHNSNYSTTHIISMGSKLFPSVKYTFHSIYSNTSPYTKHNLQNIFLKHTLGWVYVHIPILLPHGHFPLFKKLSHNTIQNIPLHILFQWDQNCFPHSNILSTQYIPTPVHTLNTTYKIFLFKHTLGWVYVNIPILLPHNNFPLCPNMLCCTTQFKLFQLHILFQRDQNCFPHSNILSTQYIPTPLHTLNTTYKIIYLNTLCVGFMFTYPFYSPTTISTCSKC